MGYACSSDGEPINTYVGRGGGGAYHIGKR
jgi:hypothetical protein